MLTRDVSSRIPDLGDASYGFRTSLEAVKDAVPIAEVAERYTTLRRCGHTLRGRCPLHGGTNPDAFAVYPKTNSFYCHNCSVGGDVVALHFHAGEFGSMSEAVVDLIADYNVEVPERSDNWKRWQDEKGAIRAAATTQVAKVYQRRLTKVFAPLVLLGGETPEEELQHLEELSAALWPECLDMARRRVTGE